MDVGIEGVRPDRDDEGDDADVLGDGNGMEDDLGEVTLDDIGIGDHVLEKGGVGVVVGVAGLDTTVRLLLPSAEGASLVISLHESSFIHKSKIQKEKGVKRVKRVKRGREGRNEPGRHDPRS